MLVVLENLKVIDKEAKDIRASVEEIDAFDIVMMMEDHCAGYQKSIWFISSMIVK